MESYLAGISDLQMFSITGITMNAYRVIMNRSSHFSDELCGYLPATYRPL